MGKFVPILLALVTMISVQVVFGDANPSGFTNAVSLSSTAGNSTTPQMIVTGTTVYVTWVDNTAGKFNIFFAKSTDDGVSFQTPLDISNTAKESWSL